LLRRWSIWVLCSAVVGVVAFAPFRRGTADSSGAASLGLTATTIARPPAAGSGGRLSGDRGPDGAGVEDGSDPASTVTGSAGLGGRPGEDAVDATSAPPPATRVSQPTAAQLAVLGPLIRAMDTGQRAGTPLLLGIATSLVAAGLPGDDDVPAELRPIVGALADLIATPGAQVNDLTTQSSLYLAQLDKALGQLAFANPALNETIHEVAAQLAALGRTVAPTSPPAALTLSDLSVLLTFFVVG
jgi:hypothetical protein